MRSPYGNFSDDATHERAIAFLALETHVPVSQIEPLYQQELAVLRVDARITAYLDILTSRKIREMLRQRGSPPLAFSGRLGA